MKVGIKLTLKEIKAVQIALSIAEDTLTEQIKTSSKYLCLESYRSDTQKLFTKFGKMYEKGYKHIENVK